MAYNQSPGRMNMPKTGRGINAATLMTGSPAKKFPIKEGTKLAENEAVTVNIQGVEKLFKREDLGKAKASLSEYRNANPNAKVGNRGSITGVTVNSDDNSITEQRFNDPKLSGSGSKQLKLDNKKINSKFKIVTDENTGTTKREYL
tara:strand:+ start:394 stop:831 length:438 start_codon:yes stop_codon:yes gene_type:complete